ncbi:MAG: protein kinase [Chlamydiota bacterium]
MREEKEFVYKSFEGSMTCAPVGVFNMYAITQCVKKEIKKGGVKWSRPALELCNAVIKKVSDAFRQKIFKSARFFLDQYQKVHSELQGFKVDQASAISQKQQKEICEIVWKAFFTLTHVVYCEYQEHSQGYSKMLPLGLLIRKLRSQKVEQKRGYLERPSAEKKDSEIVVDKASTFWTFKFIDDFVPQNILSYAFLPVHLGNIQGYANMERWLQEKNLGKSFASGANGNVFWYNDLKKGKLFVVKVTSGLHKEKSIARKLATLQWLKKNVSSPDVMQMVDYCVARGKLAVQLTVRSKQTLWRFISTNTIDYRAFSKIVREIVLALTAMHKADVVYGDLKPANITYSKEEGLLFVDTSDAFIRKKHLRRLIGSPSHRPWEHFVGNPIEPSYDMWSLGVVMVELFKKSNFLRMDAPLVAGLNKKKVSKEHLQGYFTCLEKGLRNEELVRLQAKMKEHVATKGIVLNTNTPEYWGKYLKPLERSPNEENVVKCIIQSCLHIDPKHRVTAPNLLSFFMGKRRDAQSFSTSLSKQ